MVCTANSMLTCYEDILINTLKELVRHIGDNCLEPSVTYSEYWIEQLADHDSCYEIIDETSGQIVSEES